MKVVDMHCDTILALFNKNKEGKAESLLKNSLQIDLTKMKQGDYLLQNFAMFVHLKKVDNPIIMAHQLIDLYYSEIEKNQDLIRPVLSYQDIEDNLKENKMSAMLTLEEGDVVGNDLALLRNYYRLGVRMIALTWNFPNVIGHPNIDSSKVPFSHQDLYTINTTDGLTSFGIQYIKEMERLGIIIDVSHLSDAGFYDVLKYTKKPFVASHSNARMITKVGRNMSDDMIKQLSLRGGVMGINYCGAFLTDDEENNYFAYVKDIVKHIKHIYKVGGIDCIGLGSDFDGIDDNLEMDNASKLFLLETALIDAGFTIEEVEKIFYKNVLRVYKQILK